MATLNYSWQLLKEVSFFVFADSRLRLYGKLNSQSTTENKSNVGFELRQITMDGNFFSSGNYSNLWCAGADRGTQHFNSNVNSSSEQTIGSWSFDLWHDSQGKCSAAVSASANVYRNITPSTGDVWFDLPQIAREATLTSSADLTLKGKQTSQSLTFNNPGNFWLTVQYVWDGKAQFFKRLGQGTSHTVDFTQDELIKLYKRDKYTLRTVTHSNSSYTSQVGYKDSSGNIAREGISKIRKENDWKIAIPFFYKDGKWNLATLNIFKTEWKRGK